MREALRHRAYRAALLSSSPPDGRYSACGWRLCRCSSLRDCIAGRGWPSGTATFAAGNVAAVIPQWAAVDRTGRRPLLIAGLAASGLATVAVGLVAGFPLSSPAPSWPVRHPACTARRNGGGGRHHWKQSAGGNRGGDIPDDVRPGSIVGSVGVGQRRTPVVRVGVHSQRGHPGTRELRVDARPGEPRDTSLDTSGLPPLGRSRPASFPDGAVWGHRCRWCNFGGHLGLWRSW